MGGTFENRKALKDRYSLSSRRLSSTKIIEEISKFLGQIAIYKWDIVTVGKNHFEGNGHARPNSSFSTS